MSRLGRIALREYLSYLRTPGFWMSLLIAPLAAGLGVLSPHLLDQATPIPDIALIDLSGTGAAPSIAQALQGPRPVARLVAVPRAITSVATPQAAARALRPYLAGHAPSGRALDDAVVLSGRPDQVVVDVWSRDLSDPSLQTVVRAAVAGAMQRARLRSAGLDPGLVQTLETLQPTVRSFSPKAAGGQVLPRDELPSAMALGLAFGLFFAIFTGAGILLNSVIEEKASRILEVLLSSASVPEILGGKILGAAGLSATVIGGWSVAGLVSLNRFSPALLGEVAAALFAHGLVVWFALFFIGGYLMYAAVFAAIGAFCETVREAQTLLGPMMLLVTIPILFLNLAISHPDAPLVVALSWAPPFTPFMMTARLASGPPLWQVLGTLGVMAATVAGVLWLCARAFAAGALSTGKIGFGRLFKALVSAPRA